jgi:hypothetical protein
MGEVDEGAGEGAVREGGVNTEDWEGNGFRGDLSGYMKIGYIMFTSCHKLQNPTSDTSKFTAGFSIKMEEGSPIPCPDPAFCARKILAQVHASPTTDVAPPSSKTAPDVNGSRMAYGRILTKATEYTIAYPCEE